MATALALSHRSTTHFDDQIDSSEELEALDDAELSVIRTPKSIVLPLVVAIAGGLLAYLQAPHTVEVPRVQREPAETTTSSTTAFQMMIDEDHWATAEVAPMPLGLDG